MTQARDPEGSDPARLLVIGEGHGCHSLIRGVSGLGNEVSVCSPEAETLRVAEQFGIPVVSSIESWIETSDDTVVSSGHRQVVPPELIRLAKFLNIHYALFPKYRGMHSIVWAVLNGDEQVGITLHEMNEFLDAGPIYWQKTIEVFEKTSWELMLECDAEVERHIASVLTEVIGGKITSVQQDEDAATYVGRRNKEDCRINWKLWDYEFFGRATRALVPPYPRPFFEYQGHEYSVVSSTTRSIDYAEIPGHVVYRDQRGAWVKLVRGLACLQVLECEGRLVPATDVFKRPGARLG